MSRSQMAPESYDYLFKIVLVGNSAVGKTNILSRLTKNQFLSDSKATIGVEFGTLTYYFENDVVKAQIWDTAGQERYQAIVQAYYRGTSGALIVYDITNKDSFRKAVGFWQNQLKEYSPKDIPIALVGNKLDLEEEREVSWKEGEEAALSNDLCFFETSALTGINIVEVFEKLIKNIYLAAKARDAATGRKNIRRETHSAEPVIHLKPKQNSGCC